MHATGRRTSGRPRSGARRGVRCVPQRSCRSRSWAPPRPYARRRRHASVALAESADRVGRLRAPARAYRAASARWPVPAPGSPHRPENVYLCRTRSRHLPPSWPRARLRRGGRPTSGNKTGDAGTTRALLLLMASLQEHLDRHDVAAEALAFRRDCPLCRAERVLGQFPGTALLSPRACAAATALALATSAMVPGTVGADGQGVAVPAPPSPPPPTANVQAADGGAAPAESAGGSTPVPADSEHDGGSGAPSGGSPRSAAPAGSSTHAGDAPVSSDPPTPASGEQTAAAGDPVAGGSAATAASDPGPETAAPPASASAAAPSSAPQGGAPPSASPPVAAPARAAQPAASPAASPQAPAAPPPAHPDREARDGGGASREGRRKPEHRATTRAEHGRARRSSATGPSEGYTQRRDRRPDRASGSSDPSTRKTSERAGIARPHGHAGGQHDGRAEARGTYRVQAGDSLWRIAARHFGGDATDAETAREVNRLRQLNQQEIGTGDPDLIF